MTTLEIPQAMRTAPVELTDEQIENAFERQFDSLVRFHTAQFWEVEGDLGRGRLCRFVRSLLATQASPAAEPAHDNSGPPYTLDGMDPLLRDLIVCAVHGAMATTKPPPAGHWLTSSWEIGRSLAGSAAEPVLREALEEFHQRLIQWSEAYPLDVFRVPDLQEAARVLKTAGMTLDGISAHAIRHVIKTVRRDFDAVRAALAREPVALIETAGSSLADPAGLA